MMQRGELKPFHLERWDLAHRATNYSRWVAATGFYAIQYEHVSTCCNPPNCICSSVVSVYWAMWSTCVIHTHQAIDLDVKFANGSNISPLFEDFTLQLTEELVFSGLFLSSTDIRLCNLHFVSYMPFKRGGFCIAGFRAVCDSIAGAGSSVRRAVARLLREQSCSPETHGRYWLPLFGTLRGVCCAHASSTQQSQRVAYRPCESGNQRSHPGVYCLGCSYMCHRS